MKPAEEIRAALVLLKQAREHLKTAGAKQATNAVRRAMKSTEGAERHAHGKEVRPR